MEEDIIVTLKRSNDLLMTFGNDYSNVFLPAIDEIERYRKNQSILITSFRINMMRLCPDYSPEEFDRDIAAMLGEKDHDIPVKNARVEPAKNLGSKWEEHPGDEYLGGDYYEWDNR